MEFLSAHMFPAGRNCLELPMPQKNVGLQSQQQRSMVYPGRGQMIPMINTFDPPSDRARSRRNEGGISQADKKQYELDIDRILRGEDNRTTLMIKNIPNKYVVPNFKTMITFCLVATIYLLLVHESDVFACSMIFHTEQTSLDKKDLHYDHISVKRSPIVLFFLGYDLTLTTWC